MAKRKNNGSPASEVETIDFRHATEKRKNIPPAKIAAEGSVPKVPRATYRYSPHLPPVLRSDPTGKADRLPELVAAAGKRALTADEQRVLAEALRSQEPWLEWATKREQHERALFEVDPVALHIHERVSAQAIVRVALREDIQRELFADPQQPYQQAVQFYKHDMDWANRLILGDSLQVMSSLARRENLAGKVQMIYVDPPYGVRFSSNFQPEVGRRDVKDSDSDLTREPEMVRAYRDTWHLGVHSYLTYLRDRFLLAHELLNATGSLFVQISDENVHRTRAILDEVFGPLNFIAQITIKKTTGSTADFIPGSCDYLLWYARDKSQAAYYPLYLRKKVGEEGATGYTQVELPTGERRRLTRDEREDLARLPKGAVVFAGDNITSQSIGRDKGEGASSWFRISVDGTPFDPGPKARWKTNEEGMRRLHGAERLIGGDRSTLSYKRHLDDFPVTPLSNVWTDTVGQNQLGGEKLYVVQTALKIVERCMLMTTRPGELVLDPTLGSGTSAIVAEQWGRRWIGIDTSRVAISISRQRLVASTYDTFRMAGPPSASPNPAVGFVYQTVPHVTLKSIAQSAHLDPILAEHLPRVDDALRRCNAALSKVTAGERRDYRQKLLDKQKRLGKRAITEADRRRWDLPESFEHWTVPFDPDSDWPPGLVASVAAYRETWRAKMAAVNACIEANAEQEQLVDQPVPAEGSVRVSGPFTVEGVRPEELAMGDGGLFDPTPNELERDDVDPVLQNLGAYLTRMVQLLRQDGVTFLNNKRQRFARIEPLFEQSTGTALHAEGSWEGADNPDSNTVAIGFGPQFGPVTALQVEELIRGSRRYDELVIAGFSFDAAACAAIQEAQHPKLRIHQAYIRPDVNPGMDGLLKDTPNSQLFTVFGQPDVDVKKTKTGEFEVQLNGVDIYDPVSNVIYATGADKVAAWFLDGDFDGRCFCITQAFFPDKSAWEKIAKALKTAGDAFEHFSGTVSVPFPAGKHRRVAVKVIDPRGNEVMAIRPLPV